MILFQDDDNVWDFGSPARSINQLKRLGFTCTRAGDAYCYSNGVYRLMPADTFRYCYSSGRTGLLVEESQENLVLYSSVANAAWVNTGGSLTDTTCTSAIQGQTAPRHASAGANIGKSQDVGVFVGDNECLYALVESDTAASCDIQFYNGTAAATVSRIRLTFATGAVTQVNGACDSSGAIRIGAGPNGGVLWLLYQIKDTTAIAGATRRIVFYPDSAGAGGRTVRHHIQLTESALITSPIVTGAASNTRAADVIVSTRVPSFFNRGQISIVSECITSNDGAIQAVFAASDGTTDNLFALIKTAGTHGASLNYATTPYAETSGGSFALNEDVVFGGSFSGTSIICASGGASGGSTAVGGFPVVSAASIGSLLGVAYWFNGKINSIKFIQSALSEATLVGVTNV
jgi:hypothetical protein